LGFEPETTTVTKKVRRVGRWNPEQVRYACQINYPSLLVITFADYLWPEVKGVTNWRSLPESALEWVKTQEELIEAPIVALGTGPNSYCPLKPTSGVNGIPMYVKAAV
jgi:adenylosuccinate synthase